MKNGSTSNDDWNESKLRLFEGEKYSLEGFVGLSSVKETQRRCFLMTFRLVDKCR